MGLLIGIMWLMNGLVLAYMVLFFVVNTVFVLISLFRIRYLLRAELVRPARASAQDHFLPTITLLVPAYNEEVTIVESMRSLLRLEYPSFEVIICNDGSKDRTVDVLRRAFHFVQTDVEGEGYFQTANVRATYESRAALPAGLKRFVLIDKENGGKADALNAAINVARGEFVTSMDADSLLRPDTLLHAARPIVDDPHGVVAIGAQVGLSNGSVVRDGQVVEVRLPKPWIARFQVVEYMRSFAQGRVALSSLNSLLILSGVFALIRRDLALAIGGFLTKHMTTRVGLEYCGKGAHTVCEDMEIIVRLHRYLIDRKIAGRVAILPFPLAWTEAPEVYRDLGKQRARWYRGLLETLQYHRAIMFSSRFKRIGMFSLPYQFIFEALAPPLETLGYLLLILTGLLGMLSVHALLSFLSLAAAMSLCMSTFSILLCVFSERASRFQTHSAALFPYARLRDVARLLVSAVISNFGYRQYLVYWQLKGLRDFLRGKKGWDKFARKGFAKPGAG